MAGLQWTLAASVLTMVNVMDAVTFGPLLFQGLGGEQLGIFMFLMACSSSQVVFSWTSSMQRGVCATVMVENIPFYQAMVQSLSVTISGADLISTACVAFALTTMLTAGSYQLSLLVRLDRRVPQIPRILLVGAMGGIGLYFVRVMLQLVASSCKVPWWQGWPVLLPACLMVVVSQVMQKRYPSPFTLSLLTLLFLVAFYTLAFALGVSLDDLRAWGWLLPSPHEIPHIPTGTVHWSKLFGLLPLAVASALLALLHPCLNVPSYARLTGESFRLSEELQAHAKSNLMTSVIGTLPTYFVYTSSLLFYRAGGNDRWAGVLLAGLTMAIGWLGQPLIGLIPLPIILFLIFYLCTDLVLDSLWHSRWLCRAGEYGIMWTMAVGMVTFGLVKGLLLGILLAIVQSASDRMRCKQETEVQLRPLNEILHRNHHPHPNPLRTAALLYSRSKLLVLRVHGVLHHANSHKLLGLLQTIPLGIHGLVVDFTHCASVDMNVVEGILACTLDSTVMVATPGNLRRALRKHQNIPQVSVLKEAEMLFPLMLPVDDELRDLQASLLEHLQTVWPVHVFQDGEYLFKLGDNPTSGYLIVEGKVVLGGEVIEAGGWIGLRWHLTGQPSPLDCQAITPVTCLAVDGNRWRELVTHPDYQHYQPIVSLIL